MKKILLFGSTIVLLFSQTRAMAQDVYEACCGAEPVEYQSGEANVYVPNVFTPNGDDVNDYFMPFFNEFVKGVDTYGIYSEVGDTLLFSREGFHVDDIKNYAWDGNRPDGTAYVGAFRYVMYFYLSDGGLLRVQGKACRILCGAAAAVFQNRAGCFYPAQMNGSGYLDTGLPNRETGCF